ncbi:MAG: hypothetical protein H0V26_02160 [Solirubrobacterales bacterium]|jgi:threonine/homoserine/homoserine lactone efflux protein|nr:hypothetical protein [Solirubrobacterales bacterium]
MDAFLSFLWVFAQASQTENPDKGSGALIIIATLVAIVVVIGLVWTFVAKRGSRVPRREPHEHDHVGH